MYVARDGKHGDAIRWGDQKTKDCKSDMRLADATALLHGAKSSNFFKQRGTKSDQDYLLMLNAQDEHSLPRERVNGPLTNSPDFHRAFGCKLGTPMNPAPETKQCRMW